MADLCVKLNEPYIVHARVRLEQWFMFSHACKKYQLFCQVQNISMADLCITRRYIL